MLYHTIRRTLYRHRLERKLVRKFRINPSTTIVFEGRNVGFFSMFFQVIGALYFCKKYQHNLKINFVGGPYFEDGIGDSWWNYYFSESQFSFSKNIESVTSVLNEWEQKDFSYFGRAISSSVGHTFVDTIGIKDTISAIVSKFYNELMSDHQVIGIHYRGTDKVIGAGKESDRVHYEDICKHLQKENDLLFFVATDEQAFLDHMKDAFPNKVISYNAIRSNNSKSIHSGVTGASMYKAGEDALVDCLLLSRCKKIIRTDSNLSDACRFFNPRQQSVLF